MSGITKRSRGTDASWKNQTPNVTASGPRSETRHHFVRWLIVGTALSSSLILGRLIPAVPGLTLILESLLPWSILPLCTVLVYSVLTRKIVAIAFALIPVIVWCCLFYPEFSSRSAAPEVGSRTTQIRIATHNVEGKDNDDPDLTARAIEESAPDVVALQELEAEPGNVLRAEMDSVYPHSSRIGTLGLWSKWPMDAPTEVEVGSRFVRGLHTTMTMNDGTISVYVVHLPSVRPGMEQARNRALKLLALRIEQDPAQAVLVAGDLNTASTDRRYSLLSKQLTDSAEAAQGLGFTWPSLLPVMRLDHIMMAGARPLSDKTVNTGASDHRMVVAEAAVIID